MAQIVHDLAPGATIEFATAFEGEAAFASTIRGLAAAGATVIVDDVSLLRRAVLPGRPGARRDLRSGRQGRHLLLRRGQRQPGLRRQRHRLLGNAGFRDAASCPPQLEAATPRLQPTLPRLRSRHGAGEDDNTFGITVEKEETLNVDLQWAEPWDGVKSDIDAYLLDATGKPLLKAADLVGSTDDNVGEEGTQKPVEFFSWKNEGPETEVQLAINRCFGKLTEGGCNPDASPVTKPRVKVILLENGAGVNATEYPESSGGDVVGPVDLRPRRHGRGDQRRRDPGRTSPTRPSVTRRAAR